MNWYWRLERLGLKYSKAEVSDWARWWAAGTGMCFLDPGTSDHTLRTDISLTHRGLEKKMMVQTSGKWFTVFISDVKMLRYGPKPSASLTNVRHSSPHSKRPRASITGMIRGRISRFCRAPFWLKIARLCWFSTWFPKAVVHLVKLVRLPRRERFIN